MNIKQKLVELKNALLQNNGSVEKQNNIVSEFDSALDDQLVVKKFYRMYFILYTRSQYAEGYFSSHSCSKPFLFPNGMSMEDGFKVISYLKDEVEKVCDPSFPLSLFNTLDEVMNLERFGFTRVREAKEDDILDLFIIDGRIQLFKNDTELYKKYFEWYQEGVTYDEVCNIYNKIGLEFKDIVWGTPKQVVQNTEKKKIKSTANN